VAYRRTGLEVFELQTITSTENLREEHTGGVYKRWKISRLLGTQSLERRKHDTTIQDRRIVLEGNGEGRSLNSGEIRGDGACEKEGWASPGKKGAKNESSNQRMREKGELYNALTRRSRI